MPTVPDKDFLRAYLSAVMFSDLLQYLRITVFLIETIAASIKTRLVLKCELKSC